MNQIAEHIIDFLSKLIKSFDNSKDGLSARKLSAFAGVCMGAIITFKYVEGQYLVEVLAIWLIFALLCLGIITMEQVINLKNGKTQTNDTQN
jgi:surfactin synthase thioesterase subunit